MIEKIGVPVIYNGDWVEETPLGKAEWIKLFGALFNKEQKADSVFNHIEKEYNYAKTIAKGIKDKPTVLSGALHKDVWYLPAGTSVEGELLKDANVNYLWQDSVGKGSLALSFETVLEKAKTADIWLSPSYFTSYKNMLEANGHYEQFEAFKQQKIFSFSNTIGATGGVLYYELGTARPDLVLKDIIKTCHNELLPDYTTTFFKPLD
jgi:iron complex transport system substrate-binding protein